MHNADNRNAPSVGGWVIAVAVGLVAFGVLVVLGKFDVFPAVMLGTAVALIVGLFLGGSRSAAPPAQPVSRVRKIVPNPLLAVEPPAPAAETAVTKPAAFVAAPVVAPAPAPVPVAEPAAAPVMKPARAKPAPKPKAEAKPKVAKAAESPAVIADATPKVAKPKAVKAAGPARLKAPRKGRADDLKEIEGIGPALEKLVNEMGFFHFDQIASWSDADVALVDSEMKTFKGRITRDRWVAQAKIIVTEGLEAFRERAKTNNY